MNAIAPQIGVAPANSNAAPSASSPAGHPSSFSDLLEQIGQSGPGIASGPAEGSSTQGQDAAANAPALSVDAGPGKRAGAASLKEEPKQDEVEQDLATNDLANYLASQLNLPLPVPTDQMPTPSSSKSSDLGETTPNTQVTDADKPVMHTREANDMPLVMPPSKTPGGELGLIPEAETAQDFESTPVDKLNARRDLREITDKRLERAAAQPSISTTSEVSKPSNESVTDEPALPSANVDNQATDAAEQVRTTAKLEVAKTANDMGTKGADQDRAVERQPNPNNPYQPDSKENIVLAGIQSAQLPASPGQKTPAPKAGASSTVLADTLPSGATAKVSVADVRPNGKEGQAGSELAEKKPHGTKDKGPGDYTGESFVKNSIEAADLQVQPQVAHSHSAVAADPTATTSAVAQNIHTQHNVSTRTSESASNVPGTEKTEHPLPPVAPGAVMQSAKLLERIGQSELHIGVQAGEFGNVDIRTSMTHHQMTAEISVEHGDLGRALAAELPSLQNKLAEHRINSANLVLQTQTGDSSSSSHRQGDWQRVQSLPATIYSSEADSRTEAWLPPMGFVTESNARLDIHM